MRSRVASPIAEIDRRARTTFVRSSRRGPALGALVVIMTWAWGARAQIALRDDRGVTVTLARPPARIVSLLPSLTESVCALGACARIVGTDRFSNWPASVVALPKLGGIDDAQIERVVALRPDVVLLSSSARVTDRLEGLGVKVLALESRSHADVHRTLKVLGRMLAVPAEAERVWSGIERETAAARARVPLALRGKRVYFEVDVTPYGAGPGSFIGETLGRLGLANALAPELGPFPKLNPEHVVRLKPDLIMAAQTALAEMPRRPGWSSLGALAAHRTCGFSSERYELIIRPGPRMGEAAAVLADCLASLPKGPFEAASR
jgi:iron complex transport system substrate-binding protein